MRTFTAARAEIDAAAQKAEAGLKGDPTTPGDDHGLGRRVGMPGRLPGARAGMGVRAHACLAAAKQQGARARRDRNPARHPPIRRACRRALATARKEYEELHVWQGRLAGRITNSRSTFRLPKRLP